MRIKKQQKLRIEFDFVTTKKYEITEDIVKQKFNNLLKDLIKCKLIDIDKGAEMTLVDITPISWCLK